MPDKLFDQLVQNAIDFMEKSNDQLDTAPKYAVINFCSAVELFLKARLLAEHWSLIVTDIDKGSKNKKINFERFKAGNFQSVNLKTSIERLRNIVGVKISSNEEDSFTKVQQYRNMLVHFFHPEYIEPPVEGVINETIPELWSAWHYLNSLLLEKWHDTFSEYAEKLRGLNYRLIFRFKEFLKAKFEAITDDIERKKREGIVYAKCIDCGFEAAEVIEIDDNLTSYKCEVCLRLNSVFTIACPECGEDINVYEQGQGKCEKCSFEINMDYLISKFGYTEDHHEVPRAGYCGDCEDYRGSVVPYANGHLCFNCMTLHDYAEDCEWCNELNAGIDMSDSFWKGCVICEGKMGWSNND